MYERRWWYDVRNLQAGLELGVYQIGSRKGNTSCTPGRIDRPDVRALKREESRGRRRRKSRAHHGSCAGAGAHQLLHANKLSFEALCDQRSTYRCALIRPCWRTRERNRATARRSERHSWRSSRLKKQVEGQPKPHRIIESRTRMARADSNGNGPTRDASLDAARAVLEHETFLDGVAELLSG